MFIAFTLKLLLYLTLYIQKDNNENYPPGWAHALEVAYPQSRDAGAACQVANTSTLDHYLLVISSRNFITSLK